MAFSATFMQFYLGSSLEEFVASSQRYQDWLIQYGTEMYRRNKWKPIADVIQFMFTEPWPAITWAVLDYWRNPKPSFDVLRRVMQPVLPSADVLNEVKSGKPVQFALCVVNDNPTGFNGATCEWALDGARGEIAFDVPADSVSATAAVKGPALDAGHYQLTLVLRSSSGETLGNNVYELTAL